MLNERQKGQMQAKVCKSGQKKYPPQTIERLVSFVCRGFLTGICLVLYGLKQKKPTAKNARSDNL